MINKALGFFLGLISYLILIFTVSFSFQKQALIYNIFSTLIILSIVYFILRRNQRDFSFGFIFGVLLSLTAILFVVYLSIKMSNDGFALSSFVKYIMSPI